MKKIIAFMLCLLMIGCVAMAEKVNMGTVTVNGAFEARCVLPEGYTMDTEVEENGGLISLITCEDPEKPTMVLSIMFDELYADVGKLNDLDQEALAFIESTFTNEYEAEISYTETMYGTKLMVVREANGEFVDVYTIYQGYEFEFVLVPTLQGGTASLTDDQIQMVVEFLGNLDFVPAE